MAKGKDTQKPASRGTAPKADFSRIDEETKKRLIEAARKQVEEQMREQEEDAFLEHAIRQERAKHNVFANDLPTDEVEFTVELPEYCTSVRLDGRNYHHGFTYVVPRHVFNSVRDIISRAWEHQSEIEGKSRHHYQRRRAPLIGKKVAA